MSVKIHHKNTGGTNITTSFCGTSESPSYEVVVWEDSSSSLLTGQNAGF